MPDRPGVHNRSGYRTKDVRRFVKAGLRAYHAPKGASVLVRPAPGRTRGCAELGGRKMVLAVARPSKWSQRRAALIFRHEVAHLRGADHDDMPEDLYWSRGKKPRWAEGRMKKPLRDPEIVEVVQTRYSRGRSGHRTWARVHTRTRSGKKGLYEGPSRSRGMRKWFGKAKRQKVPISRAIQARIVRDPARCGRAMVVQSLIFRAPPWTPRSAKAWAERHGFKSSKVDRTGSSIRLRQYPPDLFGKVRSKRFGKGITATVGCPRPSSRRR